MKRNELIEKIKGFEKIVFGVGDLRRMFPEESNLKMSLKRMIDAGVLEKVMRGKYFLKQESIEIEKVASQLYFPSYISFESALSKYGVIDQGVYGLTLATTRHSKKMKIAGTDCEYCRIKGDLYFGFNLEGGIYMAELEKAFLDEIYLIYLGKRKMVRERWHVDGLDFKKIKEYLKKYPRGVVAVVNEMRNQ